MTRHERIEALPARWQAPRRVRALTTLRRGGVSTGPYASLNMAAHVGDEPDPRGGEPPPRAARPGHSGRAGMVAPGTRVHCIELGDAGGAEPADGSYTGSVGAVCAVLTADCLPLFVCDADAERVGLFHVGWKGLAAGMVERALSIFADQRDIHCWLGPCIGPGAFEIGPEVRDALAAPGNDTCFRPSTNPGRWMADLYELVAHRLGCGGVDRVDWDAAACTWSDEQRFFSYRRAGQCGRMASLIWIDDTV
jgi:polyphenol oxidase